jgi:periplasmic protein TonB
MPDLKSVNSPTTAKAVRPMFGPHAMQEESFDWAGLSKSPLFWAAIASVVLHLVLLAIKFSPPEPIVFKPTDSQLEVVLLNAQTDAKPQMAEVLAQVNMEGGGDRDKGRAKSPLPADTKAEDGDELLKSKERQQLLEEQQRQLLALARGPRAYIDNAERPSAEQGSQAQEEVNQSIARLQAQIDKQIEDYNKRPKKLTYGINAKGVTYAKYVDDWATKIERIGTERYPPEARGKLYDSLVILVEIDKHGNVVDVIVEKKSKFDALNKAVKQIVYAGAPYERFSKEMSKDGDILQIVRTWTFTNQGLETEATPLIR